MPENDDLLFFGRISASVSHELKNVLAVINEQAGLLEDLVCLAGQGMLLDPQRLATTAGCLLKQVRRGDAILCHLNRFAHTTDTPCQQVSLGETVALAAALGQRQAAMHQVALATTPGPDPRVTTDPFLLCRLLTLCLEQAMASPDATKTVSVGVEDGPEGPVLAVTGLAPDADAGQAPDAALATRLGVRLERAPGRIAIILPAAG